MLRHVFIINVKEGISDDVVEQKMAEMRAMKEIETVIEDITVGRTRGLFGRPDAVMWLSILKTRPLSTYCSRVGHTSTLRKKQKRLSICRAPILLK